MSKSLDPNEQGIIYMPNEYSSEFLFSAQLHHKGELSVLGKYTKQRWAYSPSMQTDIIFFVIS